MQMEESLRRKGQGTGRPCFGVSQSSLRRQEAYLEAYVVLAGVTGYTTAILNVEPKGRRRSGQRRRRRR